MTALIERHKKNIQKAKSKQQPTKSAPLMKQVSAIILGGGRGTRLYPLTLTSAKPAIHFGGYYRLIDIAISNAINSGSQKIYVITQFFSSSLHQHIYRTFQDNFFSNGYLQLLTAEERPSQKGWFAGTADAVRQNLDYILESAADYFLILSGDQLYHLNFQCMLDFAHATDADLTIATIPVSAYDAKRMGIMQIDKKCRITDFKEKPANIDEVSDFIIPEGMMPGASEERPYLASMGIYLFKREALIKLLKEDSREDFGKHLIPSKVRQGKAAAFLFDGYWEDIGTVESFHKANIAMTEHHPVFNCYDDTWPVYCRHHNLPGPKIIGSTLDKVILCEGSIIEADEITRSILGPRSIVKERCIIRDTYIIGNSFYERPKHSELPDKLCIEEGCVIFKAIIDKHVHIGKNVQLINKKNVDHYDSDIAYIRDGVIIIPRGTTIPDGYIL